MFIVAINTLHTQQPLNRFEIESEQVLVDFPLIKITNMINLPRNTNKRESVKL